MSNEDAVFRADIGQHGLQAIYRVVLQGCADAFDLALSRYGDENLIDSVPRLRRLEVEKGLHSLSLGQSFAVSRQRVHNGTYVLVESERLLFTANTRSQWVSWVAPYNLRRYLAGARQMSLLEPVPKIINVAGKVFGLLVYGGNRGERLPDQVRIVFPTEDGSFLQEEVNLRQEFPEILKEFEGQAERATEAAPGFVLRTKRRPETVSGDDVEG